MTRKQSTTANRVDPIPYRNCTRIYTGVGVLLLALAALGWWGNTLQAQTPVAPDAPATVDVAAFAASDDPDRPAFVPSELIVGVRADATARSAGAMEAAGFSVDESLSLTEDGAVIAQVVTVPEGEELQAAQEIAAQAGVLYVEPNYYIWAAQDGIPAQAGAETAAAVPAPYRPTDTWYAIDQWNMQRIHMARAWQLAFSSGLFAAPATNIIVSVVDSGVDPTHPEFAGRLLPGKNYVNIVPDGQGNPVSDVMRDDFGHGTHVTGVIAAALNDAKGVSGVAPMVKIDPRRVLGPTGSGTIPNVAQAIIDATNAGARIINLSLTIKTSPMTLELAVKYAADHGVLVVAAAGNHAGEIEYPAAYEQAISVGALNYWDTPTYYTNFGPEMDIAAPGGESSMPILSTWPKPDSFPSNGSGGYAYRCLNAWQQYRQDGGGYYCHNYGTSFASPEVAGVAALLLTLKPDLTAAQLRSILLNTALPLPGQSTDYVGAGKLDAYAAVRALLPASVKLGPAGYYANIQPSADAYTFTLRIENPSVTPVGWNASLELGTLPQTGEAQTFSTDGYTQWLTLSSGLARTQSGSAAYGKPGFLTFAVTPSALLTGVNSAKLTVNSGSGAGATTSSADLTILGGIAQLRHWFPLVMREGAGGTIPSPFAATASADSAEAAGTVSDEATNAWEKPANLASVQQITFTTASLNVALPYTVTLGGVAYTNLVLYEDGFVTLPNQVSIANPAQNRCLPQSGWIGGAIFGWWADLDSHAPGAKVTLFRTAANRVVVQYEGMASVGVTRPYTVSFQIVLDQQGNVRLNYRDVPEIVGKPTLATIGAQTRDGRVFSEIACTTSALTLGMPPASGDTIVISAADQY